jgi:hypothetical protein
MPKYLASMPRFLCLAFVLAAGACSAAPPPPKPNCGGAPGDWCTSAADGPCGAHPDEAACRADDRCRGMPYRGESLVACIPDGKGFWSNCPAVGCVARTEAPGQVPGTR